MPAGRRTGSGYSRLSVVLDSEEVLFRQQLVQPGLVDAADDGAFLVAVTDALGQREGRGHDVEQAEREESANPPGVVQVADAGDRDREGDSERDRGLREERPWWSRAVAERSCVPSSASRPAGT